MATSYVSSKKSECPGNNEMIELTDYHGRQNAEGGVESSSPITIRPVNKRVRTFSGEPLDFTSVRADIRPTGSPGSGRDSPLSPFGFRGQKVKMTSVGDRSEVDVIVRKSSGGHYSVAPKDASLIERIAHKAPPRALRVLQPHEVFVELEELISDDGNQLDLEWHETARWIKFEEDVERDTGRWGRPHVSALAFHSMVELRRGLEKGVILLDVSGDNFPVIVDKIVDQLVESEQLEETDVDFVLQALYKKHKHQHKSTIWEDLKHAAKSADGTIHTFGDHLRHRNSNADNLDNEEKQLKVVTTPSTETREVSFSIGNPILSHAPSNDSIKDEPHPLQLKRSHPSSASMVSHNEPHKLSRSLQDLLHMIPQHAESLTVLVGGVNFLKDTVVAFVRLDQSHLLGDLTEVPVPVRFIYLMLGPVGLVDYHEIGRAMATLMSDKCFHEVAYSAESSVELLDGLDQFLEDSIVLPPGDWDHNLLLPLMHKRNELRRRKERKELQELEQHHTDAGGNGDDPMERCHASKPFLGLLKDVKRLVRRYPSDFLDALHLQPLLAILFVYISSVAPAIAFGGRMEEVTGNLIGVTETLVGTGACGVLYGVFSVQPLAILAFTGPLLLFEEIFIEFAHLLHIEYLAWRACIGLWLMIIILIFSISELSFIVKSFTRFSEEIFTGVVSLFFTVEAFRTIIKIYQRNPVCGFNYPCGDYANCTNTCVCDDNMTTGSGYEVEEGLPHASLVCNQVNTALWSTLLCIGTLLIAVLLRKFRHSRFLGKQARRLVSDFGMLTAIGTMVMISYLLRDYITVETLYVPGWKVSNSEERGWLINPLKNLNAYHIVGATIPAALLGVLIYVENQLTLLLINKHEHNLMKGVGYHFDLLLVGIFAGVCGIFGLPWVCAAPVRSIQHLQALSRYSKETAPGEKPKLEGVYEQRVTNIAVHTLILLSPFAYLLLEQIPFSVIIGVFLYLAYASISGIQLQKRLKLLFMPPKHHPDIHYVRKVRTWKMNLYTLIQVGLVTLLYGLKLSPAGMGYPVAIVLLIPLRMFLAKFIFSKVEMEALNSEDDFPEEDDESTDFAEYRETHIPY